MQIIDLTIGKYSNITGLLCGMKLDSHIIQSFSSRNTFNKNFLFNRYYSGTMTQKMWSYLQETPVFLVETSMSNNSIMIPGTNTLINIPSDAKMTTYSSEEENYDDFFRKLFEGNKRTPRNHETAIDDPLQNDPTCKLGRAIIDYLGVYVSSLRKGQTQIFVWIDKIYSCSSGNQDNCLALLEQVIMHEYAHALLDVTQYGFNHTPVFSYFDYPYRFIEEACANAISLQCGFRDWSSTQQIFIESFVKNQPKEYAAGWELFESHCYDILEFWMQSKVCMDHQYSMVWDQFWSHKKYHCFGGYKTNDFPFFNHNKQMLVEPCGQETWSYKDYNSVDGLGLMMVSNIPSIICRPKYNAFWSFKSNNLCMVGLDTLNGYKYGYINLDGIEQIKVKYDYISSFENGHAVARLNGKYGIINEEDKTVIPFNLNYQDMRGLRNGYATMKDKNGKWGAIDITGNIVIPCEYDSLVIFDKDGIASVQKNGEEFFINTNGERINK